MSSDHFQTRADGDNGDGGSTRYLTRPALIRRFHQVSAELEQELPPKAAAGQQRRRVFSRKENRDKTAHFFAVLSASVILVVCGLVAVILFFALRPRAVEVADYRWGPGYNDRALTAGTYFADRDMALIGTDGAGVHTLDTATNYWHQYTRQSTGGALLADRIKQIELDKQRNLYFLVADASAQGLCRVDDSFAHWRTLIGLDRFESLADDGGQVVAAGQVKDRLWLATKHAGVAEYDLPTHRWAAFHNEKNKALPSDITRDLVVTDDGTVFIATAAGLVAMRDGTRAAIDLGPLASLPIARLQWRGGRIWCRTDKNGLAVLNTADGQVQMVVAESKWNGQGVPVAAVMEGDRALWLADGQGNVGRYDLATRDWRNELLSGGPFRELRIETEGDKTTAWAATAEGVYHWPSEDGKWASAQLPKASGEEAIDVQPAGGAVIAAIARRDEPLDVFVGPGEWSRIQGSGSLPADAGPFIAAARDAINEHILASDGRSIHTYEEKSRRWIGSSPIGGKARLLDITMAGTVQWEILETPGVPGPTLLRRGNQRVLGDGAYPLAGFTISAASLDSQSRLWLGTNGAGIGVYDASAHAWSHVKLQETGRQPSVQEITHTAGHTWVRTDKALYKVAATNLNATTLVHSTPFQWIRSQPNGTSIAALGGDGRMLIIDANANVPDLLLIGQAAMELRPQKVTMACTIGPRLLVASPDEALFIYDPAQRQWSTIADVQCRQLLSVAGQAWVLSTTGEVFAFDSAQSTLAGDQGAPPDQKVVRLSASDGVLLALTEKNQVWRAPAVGATAWTQVLTPPTAGPTPAQLKEARFAPLGEDLFVATSAGLWLFTWPTQSWAAQSFEGKAITGVTDLASAGDRVWALDGNRLLTYDTIRQWQVEETGPVKAIRGGSHLVVTNADGRALTIDPADPTRRQSTVLSSPAAALKGQLKDAAVVGGRLYVLTTEGVARLDRDLRTWSDILLDPLPAAFVPSADDRDVWLLGDKELVRLSETNNGVATRAFPMPPGDAAVRATVTNVDGTAYATVVTKSGSVRVVVGDDVKLRLDPASIEPNPRGRPAEAVSAAWYGGRYRIAFKEDVVASYDPVLRRWETLASAAYRQLVVSGAGTKEALWARDDVGKLLLWDQDRNQFQDVVQSVSSDAVPLGAGVVFAVEGNKLLWRGSDGSQQEALAAPPTGRSIKQVAAADASSAVILLSDGLVRITLDADNNVRTQPLPLTLPPEVGAIDKADRLLVAAGALWLRFGADDRWCEVDPNTGIVSKSARLKNETAQAQSLLTDKGPIQLRRDANGKLAMMRVAEKDTHIVLTEDGNFASDVIFDALLSKEGMWLVTPRGVELVDADGKTIASYPRQRVGTNSRLAIGAGTIQFWSDEGLFELTDGKWTTAKANVLDRDARAGALRLTVKATRSASDTARFEMMGKGQDEWIEVGLSAEGFAFQKVTSVLAHAGVLHVLTPVGVWSMSLTQPGAIAGLTPVGREPNAALVLQPAPAIMAGDRVLLLMDAAGKWAPAQAGEKLGTVELARSSRWLIRNREGRSAAYVSLDDKAFEATPSGTPEQVGFAWQHPHALVADAGGKVWCLVDGALVRFAQRAPDSIVPLSTATPPSDLRLWNGEPIILLGGRWLGRDVEGNWKGDVTAQVAAKDRLLLDGSTGPWRWERPVDASEQPSITLTITNGGPALNVSLINGRFSKDTVSDAVVAGNHLILNTAVGLLLLDAEGKTLDAKVQGKSQLPIWRDARNNNLYTLDADSALKQVTIPAAPKPSLALVAVDGGDEIRKRRADNAMLDAGDWRVSAGAAAIQCKGFDVILGDAGFKHDRWHAVAALRDALWAATDGGVVQLVIDPNDHAAPPVMTAIHSLTQDQKAMDIDIISGVPRVWTNGQPQQFDGTAFVAVPDALPGAGRVLVDTPRWAWRRSQGKVGIWTKSASEEIASVPVKGRFPEDTVRAFSTEGDVIWIATDAGLIGHHIATGNRTHHRTGWRDDKEHPLGAIAQVVRAAVPDADGALLSSCLFAIGAHPAGGREVWRLESLDGMPRWVAEENLDAPALVARTDALEIRRTGLGRVSPLEIKMRFPRGQASRPATDEIFIDGRFATDVVVAIAVDDDHCYLSTPMGVVELNAKLGDAMPGRYEGYRGLPGDAAGSARDFSSPVIFVHAATAELFIMDKDAKQAWKWDGDLAHWDAADRQAWAADAWRVVSHPFWSWDRDPLGRCSYQLAVADRPLVSPPFQNGRFAFDVISAMQLRDDGLLLTTTAGEALYDSSDMKMKRFTVTEQPSVASGPVASRTGPPPGAEEWDVADGEHDWNIRKREKGIVVQRLDPLGRGAGAIHRLDDVAMESIRFTFVNEQGLWIAASKTMYLLKR